MSPEESPTNEEKTETPEEIAAKVKKNSEMSSNLFTALRDADKSFDGKPLREKGYDALVKALTRDDERFHDPRFEALKSKVAEKRGELSLNELIELNSERLLISRPMSYAEAGFDPPEWRKRMDKTPMSAFNNLIGYIDPHGEDALSMKFYKNILKRTNPEQYLVFINQGSFTEFDEDDILTVENQIIEGKEKISSAEKTKKNRIDRTKKKYTLQYEEAQQKAMETNQNVLGAFKILESKKTVYVNILFKRQYEFHVDGNNIEIIGEHQDQRFLNEKGLQEAQSLEDQARKEYYEALDAWQKAVDIAQAAEAEEEKAHQNFDKIPTLEAQEDEEINKMKDNLTEKEKLLAKMKTQKKE